MKVLLDHNVPVQLRLRLKGHSISTTRGMQWERLKNGALLASAEFAGFEVLITGDQSLSYQQNNLKRFIALIVLTETKRKLVLAHCEAIADAMVRAHTGSYEVVTIPNERRGIRAVE